MKRLPIVIGISLLLFSCAKYGFINNTHVQGFNYENKSIYSIEIDSSDLMLILDSRTIPINNEIGEHKSNILVMDKIYAFWIEKNSNSFIEDFNFSLRREFITIDSISFLLTYQDSIFEDKSQSVFSEKLYTICPSNYFSFTINNEPSFDFKSNLIQDLIIYSSEKKFRFKNYILWE